MELGARIDGWLKATGKSRAELAKHCGVSYSAVSYWVAHGERKHIPPSNRHRPMIADFFGVTEQAFYYGPVPKAKKPTKKAAA